MRCSKCGTEGIPGKKFCAECGSPLSNRCSKCHSENAPGAKFCADCGSALGADVVVEGGKPSAAKAADGLRIAPERQNSETIEGERKTGTWSCEWSIPAGPPSTHRWDMQLTSPRGCRPWRQRVAS